METVGDLSDALNMLTNKEPTYDELVSLHNNLRTEFTRDPEQTVSRRALLQIVGEILEYLDFVEADIEPSLGISRQSERTRIIGALSEPRGASSIERVNHLIKQWEAVERYTQDDLHDIMKT